MNLNQKELDVVVVGAGFSGMYLLHLLRKEGYSTRVFEKGDNVGGTWYWNRYPGAGCDIETMYYCYTFSEEIFKEWTWSTSFPRQPELLKYANFVADKLDLRRDIQFNTRIVSAHFDEKINKWQIQTDDNEVVIAKYFVTALGSLSSATHMPNIKGLKDFEGEIYHTGKWPHEKVDFKGKRVGVIGTGSSGVQAIPEIAKGAEHLKVFQRSPQWVFPCKDEPPKPKEVQAMKDNFHNWRRRMDESPGGFLQENFGKPYPTFDDTREERQKLYEKLWQSRSATALLSAYTDTRTNDAANEDVANFIRSKIKEIVKDSTTAEKLLPNLLVGAKRPIFGKDYYETYNRDNVSLVDIRDTSIEITKQGIRTGDTEHELDYIVFATGFDGLTGGLLKIDILGRNDLTLWGKWDGFKDFKTNLGLTHSGFPNMFTIWGPHSTAFTNALRGLELHVEWTFQCIDYLQKHAVETIEATAEAEDEWTNFNDAIASQSLSNRVPSWYHGANIEGKPPANLMYFGDWPTYKAKYDEVASKEYEGFLMTRSFETKLKR
ncbi:NAD(P)/FAD-dependent oxidoreductase [Neobacillus novalis]|uniref:NAD(P)/FAD-dependent oxidoreductase n=1 Tax=Neobacillus novalis TaxID=220687 RepID=A0AA95MKG2_9BACI|nr:NAD(P)/FAD-dependent oxidoreductase [Neobacillus novalis]WHY83949.1 NAD(P)/FAD-dependent oxidoreductase [Neobacillus novalis]